MNFKTKLTKKAISLLLLVAMVLTLSANIGFSAFATEQQEIDFCVDKMKNLPTDDEFLNKMLKLPNDDELKKSREETIKHSDKTEEDVTIDEEEVYEAIKKVVKSLTEKFDIQQGTKEILNFASDGENLLNGETKKAQKGGKFAANMQKANAIYRWVAKNIRYDYESYDAIVKPESTSAKWKPQDAYFVFAKKTGICDGYARLLNLMMRMAGVPCMYVRSIKGADKNYGHAFNAVYVEEESDDRKGWTLLDSTWAAPNSDGDEKIKRFLSGEDYFHEINLAYVLGIKKNEYTKAIYDEFKAAEDYYKNPNKEQLIDDFNKKSPEILKELNEKYKDSAHFETIEFFEKYGSMHFKYKTDLTMEQAKKVLDESKIKTYRDFLNGTSPGSLVSPSKAIESADNLKNKFTGYSLEYCRYINEEEFRGEVDGYIDELKTMCANCIFGYLKDIENSVEQINNKINDELKKLNEKYKNINKLSEIKLIYNKSSWTQDAFLLNISVKTDLSEENLKKKLISYVDSQSCNFAEFFPAFYNTQQSLEEANRSVVSHTFHKVSEFETGTDTTINLMQLDSNSHEGKAKIMFDDLYLYDHADKDFQKILDKLCEYGLPIWVKLSLEYEKLTLKDFEFELIGAVAIKEIDATNSNRYVLEGDVLYEKTDGGEKKAIMKLYDGAYRTIGRIEILKIIKEAEKEEKQKEDETKDETFVP